MSDWKDRTKQNLSRIYQTEGAPLQAWQWLLLGVGVYLIFKGTESVGKAVARLTQGLADAVETVLPSPDKVLEVLQVVDNNLKLQGMTPTIPLPELAIMAQNIEEAFKSGIFGAFEDEDAILAEFAKLRNDRDFTQLFLVFGNRSFLIPGNTANILGYLNKFTPEIKPAINALLVPTGVKLRV